MDKIVYNGQFVKVKESIIDGYRWEKIYLKDSLVVFPLIDDCLIMIEERRPHERIPNRIKYVTGHIDHGEDVLEAANRELQEEIGYKSMKMQKILEHNASGTINSTFSCVLAQDLIPHKIPNPDGEETIIRTIRVPLKELEERVYREETPWTLSTLGIFKLLKMMKEDLIV